MRKKTKSHPLKYSNIKIKKKINKNYNKKSK